MSSRIAVALIMIVIGAPSVSTLSAQTRPHDEIMREVGATFASLRENLDSETFADVAENAARLEILFAEIEDFWAVFETEDAIQLAQSAQQGAHDVVEAAGDEEAEETQAGVAAIQRTCGSCHTTHREEMPDGSFRIKP